jgi:hypothetical protein
MIPATTNFHTEVLLIEWLLSVVAFPVIKLAMESHMRESQTKTFYI